MWNPLHGNRVLYVLAIAALTAWSFWLEWAVITVERSDLEEMRAVAGLASRTDNVGQSFANLGRSMGSMLIGKKFPVTGLNAKLPLGPISLSYWLVPALIIAALVLHLLNFLRFSAVPIWLIRVLNVSALLLLACILAELVSRTLGLAGLSAGWLPCLAGGIKSLLMSWKDQPSGSGSRLPHFGNESRTA